MNMLLSGQPWIGLQQRMLRVTSLRRVFTAMMPNSKVSALQSVYLYRLMSTTSSDPRNHLQVPAVA